MSNNNLLTIKEFAKRAGKSEQSIYKRLNNRLNPYVQLVENQKMLNSKALFEVYGIEVEQPYQPKLNNPFNPEQQDNAALLSAIEALNKQLGEKDKQIEQLTKLLDQQQQLQLQSQRLLEPKPGILQRLFKGR